MPCARAAAISPRSRPGRWTRCARGWQPDYLTVRRQADLQPPGDDLAVPRVVLAAARLEGVRLIDSLEIANSTAVW